MVQLLLKESTLKLGEIIDSSVMHPQALKAFVKTAIDEAKEKTSCFQCT
jgi:monomeric isocitrate dehydrogenase